MSMCGWKYCHLFIQCTRFHEPNRPDMRNSSRHLSRTAFVLVRRQKTQVCLSHCTKMAVVVVCFMLHAVPPLSCPFFAVFSGFASSSAVSSSRHFSGSRAAAAAISASSCLSAPDILRISIISSFPSLTFRCVFSYIRVRPKELRNQLPPPRQTLLS